VNLLLTGATGFIGRQLAQSLMLIPGMRAKAIVRRATDLPVAQIVVADGLGAETDWSDALAGQQVVIHTAARAHIMKDEVPDPLTEYRKVNVDATLNLARQAAAAGVKRFIFISSIKVNGEYTLPDKPFTAEDSPAPVDPYGISKLEAEQGLRALAQETGIEVVIIRPPLVYGPGVKGNFSSIINLIDKGLPLPLGAVYNQRSLVSVDNLVDLIITCIDHPAAGNEVFLAGDGHDLSTTQLLRGVARAMGKPSRLLPVPARLLLLGARLLGKKAMAQRLLCSLQVDLSKTCNLLDWKPPTTVEEGLKRCFSKKD